MVRRLIAAAAVLCVSAMASSAQETVRETVQETAQKIVGDAMPEPLAAPGDPARGRTIIVDRQKGFCLLCHSGPFPEQRFMGNLAPNLAGAGSHYDAGQLRLRIANPAKLMPDTIMPSYFVTEGLTRVARPFAGKPILDAQQIEDVIAFLLTLKEGP
jgi:sulfur-oxidizing protein SoxX